MKRQWNSQDAKAPETGGTVERSSAQANLEVAIKIGTYGEISIPYPRQVEFHSRCDYLQSLGQHTRGRPQKGMRVLAPSGSGKTSAAEAYIRLVEARMPSTATFKPIVLVPLDRATTSKKLFSSILAKFGDGFSDKGSEVVLKQRAITCFQRFQSQLLIIDEVQHLNYRSSATNDVTDTLKTLLDAGVLPIVFLGTEEAEGMFARNLQLNGRLLPPCDFKPLRATSAEDRELLAGYWERLEDEIVERKLLPTPSRLSQPWVLGALHKVSSGVIGRISRLTETALEIAIRRGAERLEIYDLAQATDRWAIDQNFTAYNPFRQ